MTTKWIAALALGCLPACAQVAGYAGPQILSRGGGGPVVGDRGGSEGAKTGFQFYAGVAGTYETGFVPAAVDAQGDIVNTTDLFGMVVNMGAYGRHRWRRTVLGLDYTGNFRHYNNNSSYDGSDHLLALSVTNQASRRLQLNMKTSAGTFSRYYVTGPTTANDLLSQPGYGVFDNRATYLETTAGFVYQLSTRLSLSGTGTGFTVRRQSKALVGLNGYSAQGTMAYRLNRTRTVDVSYSFTHYDYPKGFGETDLHNYAAGLSQGLGRRWEIAASAGVAQASTVGLEQVASDPITAALFGTQTTVRAFARTFYFGTGRATLKGTFKRSRAEIFYSQLPSPGNGIYLSSKQANAGGLYSYTGIRRASLSLGASYVRMGSIGQIQLGHYTYASGSVSASYKLWPTVEASTQFDTRNVQIDQTNGFARLSYRFTFGLNWHPGEIPITFW